MYRKVDHGFNQSIALLYLLYTHPQPLPRKCFLMWTRKQSRLVGGQHPRNKDNHMPTTFTKTAVPRGTAGVVWYVSFVQPSPPFPATNTFESSKTQGNK